MFNNFYLKFELLNGNKYEPTRGTKESAGIDFYSPCTCAIPARGSIKLPLDISIEMPIGYAMIMKEKSGVAVNKNLDIGACVIDSDYRGNIHAHFFNNSDVNIWINEGEKIIQGIIIPVYVGNWEIVSIDKNTERGEGGFGSTGV